MYFRYLNDILSAIYIILAILFPFLFLAGIIIKAREKKDYSKANLVSKLIMLTGILYSIVAYYNF